MRPALFRACLFAVQLCLGRIRWFLMVDCLWRQRAALCLEAARELTVGCLRKAELLVEGLMEAVGQALCLGGDARVDMARTLREWAAG